MKNKIATILAIGFLLTTSFITIGVTAEKLQINTGASNISMEEKIKGFLDSLNEKKVLDSNIINKIKSMILSNNHNAEIIPGTFIFIYCDPINIEGIGIVYYDSPSGIIYLDYMQKNFLVYNK